MGTVPELYLLAVEARTRFGAQNENKKGKKKAPEGAFSEMQGAFRASACTSRVESVQHTP
jgi:hypothetical protein